MRQIIEGSTQCVIHIVTAFLFEDIYLEYKFYRCPKFDDDAKLTLEIRVERKRNNRSKFSRENEGGYLLQANETHKFITHLKRHNDLKSYRCPKFNGDAKQTLEIRVERKQNNHSSNLS